MKNPGRMKNAASDTLTFDPDAAGGVRVDLDRLIKHKLAVQANSGGGKSWLIRTILEGTHGHVQHLVLDPEGEYRTLREAFADYLVIGGRDADLSLAPDEAGRVVGEIVRSRANLIIDLSDFGEAERAELAAGALNALMALPRREWRHVLVIIDEAQTLAPQDGSSVSLDAIKDYTMRGRKRGYGLVVATQRISMLNKNVLALCSNRLIGLTTLGLDVRTASQELGFTGPERQELKKLRPGEFFAFGPAVSQEVIRVRSGPVRTSHPEPGGVVPPTPPASAELARLIERLAQSRSEAAADESVGPKGADGEASARLEARVTELEDRNGSLLRHVRVLEDRLASITHRIRVAAANLQEATDLASSDGATPAAEKVPAGNEPTESKQKPEKREASDVVQIKNPRSKRYVKVDQAKGKLLSHKESEGPYPDVPIAGEGELTSSGRDILETLARFESVGVAAMDRVNLAVFSARGPKSSAFRDDVSTLKDLGLVDYPRAGEVCLTESGRKRVPGTSPVRSVEDLHEAWRRYLTESQWKIIEALIDIYPDAIEREALADRIGRGSLSSAYRDDIATLKQLGAAEYPSRGHVRASALLFPRI